MKAYKITLGTEFLKTTLLVAAVIFLHFMFVRVGGYPLTLAPFALAAFMFVSYRFKFPKYVIVLWSFLLVLPFLNLTLPGSEVDLLEFMKTYLLWTLAVTVVLFATKAEVRLNSRWVSKAALVSLAILTFYSVAQAALYRYFSLDLLYNPFGEHQYLYQYDVLLHSGEIRAPGFYLEPSFNAFIVTSMLFIAVVNNYRPVLALALAGIALLVIKALSGILIYGFILLGYLVLRGTRRQVSTAIAILIASVVLMYATSVGAYVMERFADVSVEGASTYYRLVAPLPVLRDVLLNDLTGLPFGTTEEVLLDYGLLLGDDLGSSLDNGFYLLIYYFGWVGIAAVVLAALAGLLSRGRWVRVSTLYLLGYIFLSLFYSGGIFAPEYVFILVLVIYAWRANRMQERKVASDAEFSLAPNHGKVHFAEGTR